MRSCGRPFSSARETFWSTTSPGLSDGFRCLECSATGVTVCSQSTSTTWRRWPSSKERHARTRSSMPSGRRRFPIVSLSHAIGEAIGRRRLILSVPPWFGYAMSRMVGKLVGDVIVTRDEIRGLMGGLLCVDAPPAGKTALTQWVKANAGRWGENMPASWRGGRTARRPTERASLPQTLTRSASEGLRLFLAAPYNGPHDHRV